MAVSFRLSHRYAKSLLGLALEKGSLDNVKDDMASFVKVVDESRELELMLNSPIIKTDKKRAVLDAIFEGKVSELTIAFFDLITKKGREKALYSVAREFLRQYDEHKGIQKAVITTATDIDKSILKEFEKMLAKSSGKTIELTHEVKEDLIAGYVLRVEDKQLDQSVKSQLNKVKKELTR